MATEKPFAERFTNPAAVKPGKRTYDKPASGFIAPGGGVHGNPPEPKPEGPHGKKTYEKPASTLAGGPNSARRPVVKPGKITQPPRVEAGLVIGSPKRLNESVERARNEAGHPKGKRQNVEVLPGIPSPKQQSGFMSPTNNSARRAAERIAYPAKPRQPNPWEKPGLDPTLAINLHAGHGVSMNVILHNDSDAKISPEEVARAAHNGAAGRSATCIPDYEDMPHPGKRTGSPDCGAGIDHVAAQIFARPIPGAPPVPELALSKLGKRTLIKAEKKSAQWSARSSNAMGPRKRLHPKFSARRIAGSTASLVMGGLSSARRPAGRAHIDGRACETHLSFGTNAAAASQGIADNNATVARTSPSRGSAAAAAASAGGAEPSPARPATAGSPTKMTKRFLVEHRCTSADNVFARDNHRAARLEDGSATFSATPSRMSSFPPSIEMAGSGSSLASSPTKNGSVSSVGGGAPPIGAGNKVEGARFGKRPQASSQSLEGVFTPMPMNKRAREFQGVQKPFGLHVDQSPTKSASPARIGWKGE